MTASYERNQESFRRKEDGSFFFEKEAATWVVEGKQDRKIGQNLDLRRRRKEKRSVRRRSLPDLKDESPDRLYLKHDDFPIPKTWETEP
jgi:hypothetical protein